MPSPRPELVETPEPPPPESDGFRERLRCVELQHEGAGYVEEQPHLLAGKEQFCFLSSFRRNHTSNWVEGGIEEDLPALIGKRGTQPFADRYGSMAPPGAPDGDRKVASVLFAIARC